MDIGWDASGGAAVQFGRMLRMIRLFRLSRFLRIVESVHHMLYGKSVEHTQNQHSRDDHLEMQSKMCNLGVLDLVLQAFESEKLHPDMRSEVAQLGYRLLEFGNESAQD